MFRLILTLLTLNCLAISAPAQSQDASETLLSYTHGVRAKGAILLNIRGYEIIVDKAAGTLSRPYFSKMFPGFELHKGYKAIPDSSLSMPALYVNRGEGSGENAIYNICYFVQQNKDTVLGIAIAGAKQPTKLFERQLAELIFNNGIPDSLISPMRPVQLQFAGRMIEVGGGCQWMGSNTIQCSGHGEMNWSLHPDLEEARQQTALQVARNAGGKQLAIAQDLEVPVIFEGSAVNARKVTYRLKGALGLIARQEGSRTLICYYVSAPVRGHYVSCALSYWTSDVIQPNGLPLLLGTVMELK